MGNTVYSFDVNGFESINPFQYRGYYYDKDLGLYYLNSRYYNPSVGRFINADRYVSTGQGLLGHNMFTYCGNNPINRVDPLGCSFVSPVLIELTQITNNIINAIIIRKNDMQDDGTVLNYARTKPNMRPNPNKRKGSENRKPTGERQRNVGHPDGEEHSRVPKGNRGVRRIEALFGIAISSFAIAGIVLDDITMIGAADDAAIIPATALWWDYVIMLFN